MAEAKKRGPLFWVLLGIIALLAILGVVLTSIGYFASQQGAPSSVSTSNPGYAALKLLTTANPQFEIIREEPEKMQILVRDKATGEYFLNRVDEETKAIRRIPVPADQVK